MYSSTEAKGKMRRFFRRAGEKLREISVTAWVISNVIGVIFSRNEVPRPSPGSIERNWRLAPQSGKLQYIGAAIPGENNDYPFDQEDPAIMANDDTLMLLRVCVGESLYNSEVEPLQIAVDADVMGALWAREQNAWKAVIMFIEKQIA